MVAAVFTNQKDLRAFIDDVKARGYASDADIDEHEYDPEDYEGIPETELTWRVDVKTQAFAVLPTEIDDYAEPYTRLLINIAEKHNGEARRSGVGGRALRPDEL
jgi:hypothetical protein